jgi:HK97 family phage prohead protease
VSAVREGLLRSVAFAPVRAADDDTGDGLTLEGYAAVFGQRTEIDSWEGAFVESIRKGAFRKSIRERTPVLQFDHGRHPLLGSIPIGAIRELREDEQGLYVSARLSDNWLVEPVRQAIAEKTVDGMSFRFTVVREEWRDKDGKLVKPDELGRLLWDPGERGPLQRELIELRVAELGPVVFPAYEGTSELRREVRAGLARDAAVLPEAEADDLADPALRREVARALLFGDDKTSDAPPAPGHPSASEPRQDAGLTHEDRDAPPAPGHPSPDTDAPLHEHPSAESDLLRARIREIAGLMGDRLATITEET